jgi:hypothetical protein
VEGQFGDRESVDPDLSGTQAVGVLAEIRAMAAAMQEIAKYTSKTG